MTHLCDTKNNFKIVLTLAIAEEVSSSFFNAKKIIIILQMQEQHGQTSSPGLLKECLNLKIEKHINKNADETN